MIFFMETWSLKFFDFLIFNRIVNRNVICVVSELGQVEITNLV